jgi:glucose-1-phosphate thymidylyltransferase
VSNTEIEHSIVLEHSVISDIPRLSDSLIGKEARVRRSGARPRANRLMVGDHSVIDLE